MKIKQIVYTKKFNKKIKKYPQGDQTEFLKKIRLFWKNPDDTSLKTHKLTGKLQNHWSFSLSYHLRIMFRFSGEDIVEFIDIGGHEIYK